ncbi:actin-like ATPase domain-containing protein [Ascobolus immersus RN42]|uniref:Actin-like ATPase domain-containing protein n=1 Tax=Ascobolus immersus RN42 TaxID=1160509 RepID=A0A3N4IBT1_ASCIM|nr:actin-like ATPase domain-containing protein [Ascobolus immersus RN42]
MSVQHPHRTSSLHPPPATSSAQRHSHRSPSRQSSSHPTTTSESHSHHRSSHHHHHSSSLHGTEEPIILEIGTRVVRAGFPGELSPRCTLTYKPDYWRRVGEKGERRYMRPDGARGKVKKEGQLGGGVLYKFDTGLKSEEGANTAVKSGKDEDEDDSAEVEEDVLERVLRDAYTRFLLIDPRSKRVILPVPAAFPTKRLRSITKVLLAQFGAPSVTFFPSSVFAVAGAGVRSGLVVDIGWYETIVEGVYELRPVKGGKLVGRSRRAGSMLRDNMRDLIHEMKEYQERDTNGKLVRQRIDDDELDEIVARGCWCRTKGEGAIDDGEEDDLDQSYTIPLPDSSPKAPVEIMFDRLSLPVESTFFRPLESLNGPADVEDDPTLPQHIYDTLLSLPIDVRAACLNKIIFVGETASVPGLQTRVIHELHDIIRRNGWKKVKKHVVKKHGTGAGQRRNSGRPGTARSFNSGFLDQARQRRESMVVVEDDSGGESTGEAAKEKTKPAGALRVIKSFGVWTGGSLLASAKVQGKYEVEREAFARSGYELDTSDWKNL